MLILEVVGMTPTDDTFAAFVSLCVEDKKRFRGCSIDRCDLAL